MRTCEECFSEIFGLDGDFDQPIVNEGSLEILGFDVPLTNKHPFYDLLPANPLSRTMRIAKRVKLVFTNPIYSKRSIQRYIGDP